MISLSGFKKELAVHANLKEYSCASVTQFAVLRTFVLGLGIANIAFLGVLLTQHVVFLVVELLGPLSVGLDDLGDSAIGLASSRHMPRGYQREKQGIARGVAGVTRRESNNRAGKRDRCYSCDARDGRSSERTGPSEHATENGSFVEG